MKCGLRARRAGARRIHGKEVACLAPYDKIPDDSVPEPDDSPLGELTEAEPEEAAPSGELEELAAPAGEAASGTEDGAEPPGEAEDGAEPPPAQRAESPFVRSVKRLWFRAANAFFAYCYFGGIQLLRTTRALSLIHI